MTKAERTRQLIVEKAAPLFNQKGLAGTSMRDIMDATRLTKGGIYGNFESKEEIFLEVFDHILSVVDKEVRALTAAQPTIKGKLFAILDFYREYPSRPPMKGGCPVQNFGVEADDTNPLVKKKAAEAIQYFQSSLEKLLQKGIQAGEFSKDLDTRLFAIKIYMLVEGGILISRILGNNRQLSMMIDLLKEEIGSWAR